MIEEIDLEVKVLSDNVPLYLHSFPHKPIITFVEWLEETNDF